ncbi:PREDICTED: rab9 effector protein with kelch motifs [Lepidothrix coronata]|uniref:Rab9 effector protein with kelch motifs n=1 Tax=Lepidothrix coronata TaxID=321398 RepID=A0A6J0GUN4_9PASS|nr:PREDICTED: rab9 effector protein with kelch motifs [Lepidothrix coronata]
MAPRALLELPPGGRPQAGRWYRLSPLGERPRARVGLGCLALPGRVLLLGGADPAGAFADAHFVELAPLRWVPAGWRGLRPRYEHATFLPGPGPPRLWVFGGAHPAGNRGCVQVLDPETGTWESPAVKGSPPQPRTFHTSSAAVGARLFVFGGGHRGAEPVRDQRLHVFDTATLTWSQPDTRGDPPSPRHGHAVVAVGTKLFIHGGLAGDVFYNDLFCIDTSDMRWVKVPATGDVPGGRASHSSAVFREHVYIFGGIGPEGTLDTMYKYHTGRQQWTLLQFESPMPAGRLDHAMCVIPWQAGTQGDRGATTAGTEAPVPAGDSAGPLQQGQGSTENTVVHLLLVFGGMDTQGQLHGDCLVTLLE